MRGAERSSRDGDQRGSPRQHAAEGPPVLPGEDKIDTGGEFIFLSARELREDPGSRE
jgi:hypothetical protein